MKSKWWYIGLGFALIIACLSPLASSSPDGLERVAENKGFLDRAWEALYTVIPDYVFPGISNESLATIIAGLVCVFILFGLGYGAARLLKSRGNEAN